MYEYIKGTLVDITPTKIVLETNNIGYQILIPSNVQESLPQLNSEMLCYVSLIVKEDSHTLFGFSSKIQKDLFEKLITVSGIGPKTALALLGHLDMENFYNAVINANVSIISKVPGIGKKTAERLIIELKDKLSLIEQSVSSTSSSKQCHNISDALNALIHLGYSHMQAQKALKKITTENPQEKDTGKLISLALQQI